MIRRRLPISEKFTALRPSDFELIPNWMNLPTFPNLLNLSLRLDERFDLALSLMRYCPILKTLECTLKNRRFISISLPAPTSAVLDSFYGNDLDELNILEEFFKHNIAIKTLKWTRRLFTINELFHLGRACPSLTSLEFTNIKSTKDRWVNTGPRSITLSPVLTDEERLLLNGRQLFPNLLHLSVTRAQGEFKSTKFDVISSLILACPMLRTLDIDGKIVPLTLIRPSENTPDADPIIRKITQSNQSGPILPPSSSSGNILDADAEDPIAFTLSSTRQ